MVLLEAGEPSLLLLEHAPRVLPILDQLLGLNLIGAPSRCNLRFLSPPLVVVHGLVTCPISHFEEFVRVSQRKGFF